MTVVIATFAFAAAAVPAFTADGGTISLRVVVQEPAACLELKSPPGPQVDFGTIEFSRPGYVPFSRIADPRPVVLNCAGLGVAEDLYVKGSDATSVCSSNPCTPSTWTLVPATGGTPTCPTTNAYALRYLQVGQNALSILKTNVLLGRVSALGERELMLEFMAPCLGSAGSGVPFSFTVDVTAVVV